MRIRVFLLPISMSLTVQVFLVAKSVLLILLCSTSCLGCQYQDCLGDKSACPGVEFSYPFGEKGSGCGDPEFQLDSPDSDGHPLLNISGNEYRILEHPFLRNNSDHKMTIASNNLFAENCNPSCNYSQFWWSGSHFHISADTYTNLTLWGQCSEEMPQLKHLQLCGDDWYYNIPTPEDGPRSCKRHIELPISRDYLRNSLDFNIDQALLWRGFEITWQVDAYRSLRCTDCFKSKGNCGYNISEPTTFICYCPDDTSYPDKCPALHGTFPVFVLQI